MTRVRVFAALLLANLISPTLPAAPVLIDFEELSAATFEPANPILTSQSCTLTASNPSTDKTVGSGGWLAPPCTAQSSAATDARLI